jgi:hypothetical protein
MSTVSRSPEVAARRERLSERREREGDDAADLLGVGRDEHGPLGVGGQLGRPAQRQDPGRRRPPLDLHPVDRLLLGAAEAADAARGEAAEAHRDELRHDAEHADDPLRRHVRVRRRQVVVEAGAIRG